MASFTWIFQNQNLLPILFSNVKISIWTFLFYRKNHREKKNFVKNFKRSLLLDGWLNGYHVLRNYEKLLKATATFIELCFYQKWGCIKMREHAKMFEANKVFKLTVVIFKPTSSFSKSKFMVHFWNFISTNTRFCTQLLFIWKCITSTLSSLWHFTNANIFSLPGLVFPLDTYFLRALVMALDNIMILKLNHYHHYSN